MAILPIPAEERDRDDRTRLMVPFDSPFFNIDSKREIRNRLNKAMSDVKAPAYRRQGF